MEPDRATRCGWLDAAENAAGSPPHPADHRRLSGSHAADELRGDGTRLRSAVAAIVAEQEVIDEGVRFIVNSVRPDGSWPIDTNLATWVTTLSRECPGRGRRPRIARYEGAILAWLLEQQYKERHPYTGADPGGWAWTDLPGGVPDCDDTPGACSPSESWRSDEVGQTRSARSAVRCWVRGLQNRDGGFPTFCRGWGTLAVRSERLRPDCSRHSGVVAEQSIRTAMISEQAQQSAFDYFASSRAAAAGRLLAAAVVRQPARAGRHQPRVRHGPRPRRVPRSRADGLARVSSRCRYLLSVQNADGGWGGDKDCPSSVEETALAVEVLIDLGEPELTAGCRASGLRGSSRRSSRAGSASQPHRLLLREIVVLREALPAHLHRRGAGQSSLKFPRIHVPG